MVELTISFNVKWEEGGHLVFGAWSQIWCKTKLVIYMHGKHVIFVQI